MNYKLIAIQIGDLLKYDTTIKEVDRAGASVFSFNKDSFPNESISSVRAQAIHDWILTLATQKIDNEKRNSLLKQFLNLITPESSYDQLTGILNLAGVETNLTDKIESKQFDSRNYHPEINKHARKLFVQGNYFHAVFESAKTYNKKVQEKSKSQADGSSLMMSAWTTNGVLKITQCKTETDKNVQEGVKFLSAGLMQAMRNPQAHEPALDWPISKEDALDMLSFISYLFRKLDDAIYFKSN